MDNDHLLERDQRLYDAALPIAYNGAIPTNLNIVDVFEIDGAGFDFANKWITALLGQRKANFVINPPLSSIRKVEHLFFQARNTERLKGYKNISFGYPILAKKDRAATSGFLSIPIFIWDVQLEPNRLKVDQWQLLTNKSIGVRINPILEGLTPEVADLMKNYRKRLDKRGVGQSICEEFCEELVALLDYQNEKVNYSIEQFPDIVDLATMQKSGAIIWSGIFAIFPPLHFPNVSDGILSKEYWQAKEEPLKEHYQLSFLPYDHQQKSAYLAGIKHKFILVEGAAGSGKNYTIVNALIGQLLNGRTSLAISSSIAALEKIAQNLAQEGFSEYSFLFKNSQLDRGNLIENVLAKAAKNKKLKSPDIANFSKNYHQFLKLRQQLEQVTSSYRKNVFDINNWTESVGLYLKNSRQEGKELLDTQLYASDFEFEFLEYEQLKEKIRATEDLFQEVFSFYHPLNEVDEIHFTKAPLKEAKNKLLTKLNKYLKQTRKVQRTYFQKVGLYKQELEDHYEASYLEYQQKLSETKEAIDQLQLQLGHEYDKTSVGNLKILKTFSSKSKKALSLKSTILTKFETLKALYFEQPVFDFQFLETASTGNIKVLIDQLNQFEQTLKEWKARNRQTIQEKLSNLSSKTVLGEMKNAAQITEIEHTVEKLVVSLNQSKLFKRPFNNNAMTLQLKEQLLDEIIEKLNSTKYSLRDFSAFFEWKNLSTSFSAKETKVITSLIKARPKNWLAAFEAWYFHNLLTKESGTNANFEPLLASYFQQYQALKEKTPAFINGTWQKLRAQSFITNNSSDKRRLNTFLKKPSNKASFVKYLNIHLKRIQRFYPIILMTVEMAKELFEIPLKSKFDTLIINEGEKLTKEQGGSLLNLARQVQVYGTGQVGIPNSFWPIARSLAGKHILLKNQHRSQGIPILAFNNAAFDQQLDVYLNGQGNQEALQIYAVDGDYEVEEKTNEAESRYMLSLLTGIKGTPQNTYPKVGFVCATIEQRNLFASYLLKIKQKQSNGAEKIKHLERNGMGVYAFDELEGQTFDILIISFTYGIISEKGELTKAVNYFDTKDGQITLQQLLNSGTKQVIVCHSFPKTFIQQYHNRPSKNGLSILANFLLFGKAVSAGNTMVMHDIVHQISTNITKPKIESKAIFLEEVSNYLTSYFEPNRILKNYSIKNKVYPLVIKGKTPDDPNFIIEADKLATKSNAFSFLWYQVLLKEMEAAGYKTITIWSRNWWRNPEGEARKLASRIIREETIGNGE